jgi:hypothetical protein
VSATGDHDLCLKASDDGLALLVRARVRRYQWDCTDRDQNTTYPRDILLQVQFTQRFVSRP